MAIRGATTLAIATPSFWVGLLLIILFAVKAQVLPSTGFVSPLTSLSGFFRHLVLPVATLAAYLVGALTRYVYVEAVRVGSGDQVRTFTAMGLHRQVIRWRYVLREAVLPLVTVLGIQAGSLVAGAVLVEQVFGLGGVGQLMLEGVLDRDYPLVEAAVILTTVAVVLANALADILRRVVDPRVR